MNEERINEVIAEELTKRGGIRCEILLPDMMEYQPPDLCTRTLRTFTRSLDSTRLFEETLSYEEWQDYAIEMELRTGASHQSILWKSDKLMLQATPLQRCEAFLRTIGRNED